MGAGEKCGECGTAIPVDSPGGFCVQCLLRLGLGEAGSPEGGVHSSEGQEQESEVRGQKSEDGGQRAGDSAQSVGVTAPLTEKPGDRIGRYRLLEEIGHGGCGVVYMAEQEEPVRRKVALKVIKLGMDTRQVVARFEAERQALALMDHPNIAKVLDAGATVTGRPYFVMELVGGIKITDYCNENNLGTRQRLDLFIQVCRAIQHAHQKGVIHRDIKPSNVLVATQDGTPMPKVIDFGIAKATQGRLTDQTVFTAFEQFIGTPAYMSPEQAQLGGLDVDTRSDIYSLGVLLYELLTGKTPFDAQELMAAGLEAMRRTIQEEEPPTPSTRLSQELVAADVGRRKLASGSEPETSADSRRRLQTRVATLRGDLDWIVMKCLEKDRARRYETANGLARDIERHLKDEPVVAGPPSRIYRLEKAIRRNKTTFFAAAALALVFAGGAVVSTWQAVRATRAKGQADTEKRRADDEAAKQEAINRFLNDMLASADPYELSARDNAKGPSITMLQVVDAAARQVNAGSLKGRPEIEAAICQTLGETYFSLFQLPAAEPLLVKALKLNRQIYGEQSDKTIQSLRVLAHSRMNERVKLLRQVLAMERRLHGDEHPHVAGSMIELADIQSWDARGRYGSADLIAGVEDTYRQGLALQRKLLPSESPDLAPSLASLANFLLDFRLTDGATAESEDLLREALRIQTVTPGRRHPSTARTLELLAKVLCRRQKYAGAQQFCEEAIALQRQLLGSNQFQVSRSLDLLGAVLQYQQKLPEAESAYREALAIRRQATPEGLDLAWSLRMLAENLVAQKHFEQAEQVYREALAFWASKVGGLGREAYWFHLDALTKVLKSENKLDETEALYREVLERDRNALGNTNVVVPAILCRWGDVLDYRNRPDEAGEKYREAVNLIPKLGNVANRVAVQSLVGSLRSRANTAELTKLYEKLVDVEEKNPEHPNFVLATWFQDFGDLLARQSRFESAAAQYQKALSIRRIKRDLDLFWTLRNLGNELINCSRMKEAEVYLRESLTLYRALNKADDLWGTAWPTTRLAEALYQQGKLSEAKQTYRDALAAYRSCNAIDALGFSESVQRLVELLAAEGKIPEAQSLLDEVLAQERQAFGLKDVRTAATLVTLGRCLKLQSKLDSAADCWREAKDIIVNSRPEDLLHLPPAVISEMRAAGLKEQSREVCNRVLTLAPTVASKASWLNAAAWALTLSESRADQDPALAVELERKAIELPGEKDYYQSALGPALYRANDWQGAVAELEAAVLRDEGYSRTSDLLFLAMAYQCLSNGETAERHYSQAVNWMTGHSPCHGQLLRLRAETEALLRVVATPQPPKPAPGQH